MNELDEAIKALAKLAIEKETEPHEAMQLAQAVLSLAQAKGTLAAIGLDKS